MDFIEHDVTAASEPDIHPGCKSFGTTTIQLCDMDFPPRFFVLLLLSFLGSLAGEASGRAVKKLCGAILSDKIVALISILVFPLSSLLNPMRTSASLRRHDSDQSSSVAFAFANFSSALSMVK